MSSQMCGAESQWSAGYSPRSTSLAICESRRRDNENQHRIDAKHCFVMGERLMTADNGYRPIVVDAMAVIDFVDVDPSTLQQFSRLMGLDP